MLAAVFGVTRNPPGVEGLGLGLVLLRLRGARKSGLFLFVLSSLVSLFAVCCLDFLSVGCVDRKARSSLHC